MANENLMRTPSEDSKGTNAVNSLDSIVKTPAEKGFLERIQLFVIILDEFMLRNNKSLSCQVVSGERASSTHSMARILFETSEITLG